VLLRTLSDAVSFREEKMAKVNLFETRRFFCDLYCLRPGQEQKIHVHDDADKVYVAFAGSATVIVGGEERELAAGQAVLAPAGEAHGLRNDSGADFVCLVTMAPHPSPPDEGSSGPGSG
jgi:quercetin dioxygenase-like cupin family protein